VVSLIFRPWKKVPLVEQRSRMRSSSPWKTDFTVLAGDGGFGELEGIALGAPDRGPTYAQVMSVTGQF